MSENISLHDLRARWTEQWGITPHKGIGPTLLQKSIDYKIHEQEGRGLSIEIRNQLENFIKQYKRNPKCFDERCRALKTGTRLIRKWRGKEYSFIVKQNGFEYQEKFYTSLSQIANDITGTRWNGYLFFGLKKRNPL